MTVSTKSQINLVPTSGGLGRLARSLGSERLLASMLSAVLVLWLLIEQRGARTLPLALAVATVWGCVLLGIAAVADLWPRLRGAFTSATTPRCLVPLVAPAAVVVGLVAIVMFGPTTGSRWTGGIAAGIAFLLMASWRVARRLLDTVPRLLVIGGAEFRAAMETQAHATRRRVVGWLDPSAPDFGMLSDEALDHDEVVVEQRCLARLSDVPTALRRHAQRVYVADAEAPPSAPAGGPFRSPLPLFADVFKRGVDITVAGTLLLLAAPVLCMSAVAIAADSPGGVLFRQTRVGRDGQRFTIYKLRTMVTGASDREHQKYVASLIEGRAPAHDGVFKMVADPRNTRVGRWLRRWSIDELPQLWNVLAGSMSLVGPRPSLPEEVELFTPVMLQRTRVKPGMTGLSQVSGRSRLSFDEMVALDVGYWRAWSILLEIGILVRTPFIVLTGRGAA